MASRKLFLADDSITIQRVIELTFSHEDMEVISVGDGEEAITRIPEEMPDIVLADIAMPKRSGYEVAAFVKSRPDLAHIPVVLLAGAFEPVDEARAQQSGSNGVLVKPFEPQHVIARVRELVDGARGNPSAAATADIPRPAARLAGPRPVELPKRDRVEVEYDFAPAAAKTPAPPPEEPRSRPVPVRQDPPTRAKAAPRPAKPHPPTEDSLDDYFDRLDAAFADLDEGATDHRNSGQRTPARPDGPVLEGDLDFIDAPQLPAGPDSFGGPEDEMRVSPAIAFEAADESEPPPIAASMEVSEIPTLEELLGEMDEGTDIDAPFAFEAPIQLPAPEPAGSVAPPMVAAPPVEPPETSPTLAPAPPAPVVPVAPEPVPVSQPQSTQPLAAQPHEEFDSIADVFNALLAVEQGEAADVHLPMPHAQPTISDELVEQVADRVLARLQAQAGGKVDDTVARIVSEVAERLVREEIKRIRDK